MNQVEELQLLEREIARHAKHLVTAIPADPKEMYAGVMQATQVLANDPGVPPWAIVAWREVGVRIIHAARIAQLTEDQ